MKILKRLRSPCALKNSSGSAQQALLSIGEAEGFKV